MNITILLDRSYRSQTLVQTKQMYNYVCELVRKLSVDTSNKFRFGSFGTSVTFLSCTVPLRERQAHKKPRLTDFNYKLKPHLETPHQEWTEDVKAELLLLLKGYPFPIQGQNNIRVVLQNITQGPAEVKADHVVIIACWPPFDSHDLINAIKETASVLVINLSTRCADAGKVARTLKTMTTKKDLSRKSDSRTPYEELQLSMLTFLKERAPVLLKEAYPHLSPPCEAAGSDCSAKTYN